MRYFSILIVSMFMLSSCSTMKDVADTTVDIIKTPYEWVVGDDEDDDMYDD